MLNYESSKKRLPPSVEINAKTMVGTANGAWGVHGHILPYMEEESLRRSRGYQRRLGQSDSRSTICAFPSSRAPATGRPREVRDPGGGKVLLYSTTYGFNMGTWFVYDPATNVGGDGVFYPNSYLRLAKISDGTSKTLMAAEVKAWTHYTRNGGPSSTTIPDTADAAAAIVASGAEYKNTGHTEWPDGRVHHTGFTATMPPNTFVKYCKWQRKRSMPTSTPGRKAKTARPASRRTRSSRRAATMPAYVNAAMVDGSVQSVNNDIDLAVWRAKAHAGRQRDGFRVTSTCSFSVTIA